MKTYQNSIFGMGTRFNLLLPGIDNKTGDKIFSSVTGELIRIEKLLSCFLQESIVSYINQNAFKNPVSVDDETFDILKECAEFHKLTNNHFDIGLGYVIDYWSGGLTEQEQDIHLAGAKNIILDYSKKTVLFSESQVKINLGGYGKGYALEKVLMILKESGIENAFISFGESSVGCLGKHPYGDYWPVGIPDFYNKDKSLATFKLIDGSVSTSNNLQNNHIINPVTGEPVTKKMSVSVKSPSPVIAEVLSTALMAAPEEEVENILKSFPGAEAIIIKYNDRKAEVPQIFR